MVGSDFEKQFLIGSGQQWKILRSQKFLWKRNDIFMGCSFVIEKSLKANLVKITQEFAPKSHNLIYLAEKSKIELSEEQLEFFGILMKYQLEGRYPGYSPVIPLKKEVENYLVKTKESLQWLKLKL